MSTTDLDGIPLASQGKSLVQVATGDKEGAQRTQDNFTKRCVGVSQLRSAFEERNGDQIAANATKAEFTRAYTQADDALKAKLAPIEPMAKNIAGYAEKVITPLAQQAEQAVERVMTTDLGRKTAEKAGEVGTDLGSRIEQVAAAADLAAASLCESDLGKSIRSKFTDLLAQHQGGAGSDSCGAASSSSSAPVTALDKYTILTEASGPQAGVQCSCCLEPMEEGESIRVLPCFHTLHHNCAEQWLLKQSSCPVCRCGLVASLEAMQ